MKEYNKVIDYIIDQSDKYDIRNLQIEQDIQFLLKKKKDLNFLPMQAVV